MRPNRIGNLARAFSAAALILLAGAAQGASCTATSTERRVALLELYTSEGCSSCPPTDRWVSALPTRGYTAERVVVLGFHVDYWDYIGWPDPYAQRRFSERQRHANTRNRSRFVYTPQLMLDGKDYRRAYFRDDFGTRIAEINQSRPGARVALHLDVRPAAFTAHADVTLAEPAGAPADVYLALLEDGLGNHVTAGENTGRRLHHDFVVRDLAGPFPVQPAPRHTFALAPDWKKHRLTVAAFVQRRDDGAVLQALALPACTADGKNIKIK